MVYLYKKKVGGKFYYYLRVSERKGSKLMVKDVAYLGTSLTEAKEALEHLPAQQAKIRKSHRTIQNFLESNRFTEKAKSLKLKHDPYLKEKLEDIEACRLHFHSDFEKLDSLTKEEVWKNFIVEFSFNTAAIEGNTITLAEARNLLEEGLTPKNKSLREIYDLQNTEKVFLKMKDSTEELNHDLIVRIHSGLLKNIDSRTGYRAHDVRVTRANFKSTPAPFVKTDMNLLLEWYQENKNKLHPFVLATLLHHKFEKIHPFMDGNGRTGRMLFNYILLKNKYPPTIIRQKNRSIYIDTLQEADKAELFKSAPKSYEKLVAFLTKEFTENYWNIFL
ncbi:MAG: Fic family protein [Candidatus Diapherotrites archaeon]